MKRPMPPDAAFDETTGVFLASPDLEQWARETFIEEGAPLANPDHFHLNAAKLGFLWTNEPNSRGGRLILGQCEKMPPMAMGKWMKARAMMQIHEWFGIVPDFLITVAAQAAQIMDDDAFCALIEHELYHAGQDRDEFGAPKFGRSSGLPVFALRGHDVEEFTGVVRRYGADATGVREMVAAANKGPEIAAASIANACGTCLRLVKA
jgi:putative metallopeptidase